MFPSHVEAEGRMVGCHEAEAVSIIFLLFFPSFWHQVFFLCVYIFYSAHRPSGCCPYIGSFSAIAVWFMEQQQR